MPFHATVFDHTRFADGFSEADNVIVVQDGLMFEIACEVHVNSYAHSVEQYLISKVVSQGWTIEFTQPGHAQTHTNPYVNNAMYQRWEQPVKTMILHGVRYGFCAVRYVQIPNTPKDDYDSWVPRIMDPISEYSLRFRIEKDGTREYMAYERSQVRQDDPIPLSRVFIFSPPEYDGVINSPLQKCFTDLQRLSSYWDRHEERDYRGTHPAFLYEYTAKNDGLVENSIPPEAIPEYDQQVQRSVGTAVGTRQMTQMYALDVGNSYIQQRFEEKRTVDGNRPEKLYARHWNPELRRYSNIPMSSIWEPQRLLDQNISLAGNIPTPTPLADFNPIIEALVRNVTNAVGIPAEVLYGGRGNFAADVQFSMQQINATVARWQRDLEPMLALMYLDIYCDMHVEIMNEVLKHVENSRREKAMTEKAERKKRKAAAQAEGIELPKKPKGSEGAQSIMISDAERVQFEKEMIVSVHFNDNPSFDYNTLKQLKEDGIISHEDFQRLALTMYHLPLSMALTPAQIIHEAEQQAKVQEVLTPSDTDAPADASKKRKSTDKDTGSKKSAKKTKKADSDKPTS